MSRLSSRLRGPVLLATIYLAAVGGAFVLARWFVDDKVRDQVRSAHAEVLETIYDALEFQLLFAARGIENMYAEDSLRTRDEMRKLARRIHVDEINVADTNGVWIASTEDDNVVGVPLSRFPTTAEYLGLMTGEVHAVTHAFRTSEARATDVRFYVATAAGDRSKVFQVGYDEQRFAADYERMFENYFSCWDNAGDGRFFTVARPDGTVFDSGWPEVRRCGTLAAAGIDMSKFPSDSDTTFRQDILGEACYCRVRMVGGHWLLSAVPLSAYSELLRMIVGVPALVLLVVALLVMIFSAKTERAKRAERFLRDAEERRRHEDLVRAREIQYSALPMVFPPYPRDLRNDLHALMVPARDVGGDFYDFHYIGPDQLAFLVADVAGKGIPAAMMMMRAKAVLRAQALSTSDLGEAVREVSAQLFDGNLSSMFVTCWIGVLNEQTGELRYVNAGHNLPYLRRADGTVSCLKGTSGMALGAWDDVSYSVFETRLNPGDALVLYTDGVVEAKSRRDGMFGESRLEEVLSGQRTDGALVSPDELCQRTYDAVTAFADGVAQSDDITLLALRYRGQPQTEQLDVPARFESFAEIKDFAERCLDDFGCPKAAKVDLLIALDAITSNIVQYSGSERMTVSVELARNPSVARFTVSDAGRPWNPLEHSDPDITLSADEREIGGLGILMMKKLMDDVSYVRERGRNVLRFRKRL